MLGIIGTKLLFRRCRSLLHWFFFICLLTSFTRACTHAITHLIEAGNLHCRTTSTQSEVLLPALRLPSSVNFTLTLVPLQQQLLSLITGHDAYLNIYKSVNSSFPASWVSSEETSISSLSDCAFELTYRSVPAFPFTSVYLSCIALLIRS